MPESVTPTRTFVVVGLLLLLLTASTLGLAQLDLHGWNPAVALAIAVVKAVLIVTFFMQLRVGPPMARVVGVAALLWLAILVLGTMDDFLTRGR